MASQRCTRICDLIRVGARVLGADVRGLTLVGAADPIAVAAASLMPGRGLGCRI